MVDPLLAAVGLVVAFVGIDAINEGYDRCYRWWRGSDPDPRETATARGDLLKWVAAGVLVGFVLLVEGKSLSSIGVETMPPVQFVAWVVGGFVFTYGAGTVAYLAWKRLGLTTPEEFTADQMDRPPSARAFTALTAGVTESILYQAYPIERLAALSGSLAFAAAVAFVAFVVAHYVGTPFSPAEVGLISVPALGVTVLYALTGNLLVVIVVHTLVDGVSLLAGEVTGEDFVDGTATE